MQLRLDSLHRAADDSCLISFTLIDGEDALRLIAECSMDGDDLALSPEGVLASALALLATEDPASLEPEARRLYEVGAAAEAFLGYLASGGLFRALGTEELE